MAFEPQVFIVYSGVVFHSTAPAGPNIALSQNLFSRPSSGFRYFVRSTRIKYCRNRCRLCAPQDFPCARSKCSQTHTSSHHHMLIKLQQSQAYSPRCICVKDLLRLSAAGCSATNSLFPQYKPNVYRSSIRGELCYTAVM